MEKIEWSELLETALTVPGHMGDTYNRFYSYSFLNQVLLMEQGVTTPVATYNRWRDLGRQVVKGSKAKEIIRPIIFDKEQDDGETKKIVRFKAVRCIFSLLDTEGEELPAYEVPTWDKDRALKNLDIREVSFTGLNGNVQGWSRNRDVAINPTATDPMATLFHEVGHVVLGHTQPEKLTEYRQHRGLMEFQAESTAYLSLHEVGELTDERASESRAYIQGWIRNERPPETAIRQVFTATDTILKAGRGVGGDDES